MYFFLISCMQSYHFFSSKISSSDPSQWAIPLEKGPEAITRLQAWLTGDAENISGIPFSSRGIFVHAPIEVRVSDTTLQPEKPWLDQSYHSGPTLYLNATLYRPFHRNPPEWERYYEAFEYLMKELGGKPHWAKNFTTATKEEFGQMYPKLGDWCKLREELDPQGVFRSGWLERNLLPE